MFNSSKRKVFVLKNPEIVKNFFMRKNIYYLTVDGISNSLTMDLKKEY